MLKAYSNAKDFIDVGNYRYEVWPFKRGPRVLHWKVVRIESKSHSGKNKSRWTSRSFVEVDRYRTKELAIDALKAFEYL